MYQDLKVQMGMAEQIMTLQLFLLFFPIISAVNSTNICVLVYFLLAAFHVHPFFGIQICSVSEG